MDALHVWLNLTPHHELQSLIVQLWPNIAASLLCGIPAVIHIKRHISRKHQEQINQLVIIKHRTKGNKHETR